MQWMGSARIGRMLRLKVHFKSRYIDNETHDDRRRGTQGGASVRSSAIRFTSAAVCCHPHGGKTKDVSGEAARHAVGEPPWRVSLASSLISSACAPVERARPGGGCASFNVQKQRTETKKPRRSRVALAPARMNSPSLSCAGSTIEWPISMCASRTR
jgi:hypothetical protein